MADSCTAEVEQAPLGQSSAHCERVRRLRRMLGRDSGVGVSFAACVDASAYAGLGFEIGGSVGSTGTLTIAVDTRENSPEPPFTATGTCVPGDPANPNVDCASASLSFPLSPSAAPAAVRFGDFRGGMPADGVDPAQMLAIWFAFPWSATAQPYPVDLTLGN